jgi:hypothetical protein
MRWFAGVPLIALFAAPAAGSELARLIAPAPGSTLVAGSTVTLEWVPGPGLAVFAHAEEWEVFLSLDGGKRFLFRITPHLDLDVRRATVRLPDFPSDNARLLLRVGDERREREQLLPGRYRILPTTAPRPLSRRIALAPGEPARPGAPGVIAWIDGDRDGGHGVERESVPLTATMAPGFVGAARAWLLAAPVRRADRAGLASRRVSTPATVAGDAVLLAPAPPSRAPSLSLLRRLNV